MSTDETRIGTALQEKTESTADEEATNCAGWGETEKAQQADGL
jgi:hypothetical protein